MSLRNIVRSWLGISGLPLPPLPPLPPAQALACALTANRAAADAENALSEIMALQLKFDALAEMLGVVVVCDFTCRTPNAEVKSTRTNGLLDEAGNYIAAATAAVEMMSLHRHLLEQQMDMTKKMLAALSFDHIKELSAYGSAASPGFMDPEGVVMFHTAGNVGFKKTIKRDEIPKSSRATKMIAPVAYVQKAMRLQRGELR